MRHLRPYAVWGALGLPVGLVMSVGIALWSHAWWPLKLGFAAYALLTPLCCAVLIPTERHRVTGQIAMVLWVLLVAATLMVFAATWGRR